MVQSIDMTTFCHIPHSMCVVCVPFLALHTCRVMCNNYLIILNCLPHYACQLNVLFVSIMIFAGG